jgi:hypothetical protein
MNDEHNTGAAVDCTQMEDLCVLHACDELNPQERAAVEAHAKACARCADALARETAIEQLLAHSGNRQEPSDIFLAQCRSELAESLDDVTEKRAEPSWLDAFRPARLFARAFVGHPAWSAALLVLFGVTLGAAFSYWRPQSPAPAPAFTVSARPRISDQDLQNMNLGSVSYAADNGSGQPGVELHMTSDKPIVLSGSPDDTEVKRVLTFVITNGQRFDPGVRLDSLEVLRTRASDSDVRKALCAAARKDSNPGVRLRALESLRGVDLDDQVRMTLLEALTRDDNPGVRVEAINLLSAGARALNGQGSSKSEDELVRVLRDHMERDPSNYVRMQSAAALRDIGPRRQF